MKTQKRATRKSTPRTRRTAHPDVPFPEGFTRRLQQAVPKLDLVDAFLRKPEVMALGGAYAGASLCVLEVRLVVQQFLTLAEDLAAQQNARGAR